MHLGGETFRYWTTGDLVSGDARITFLRETFSYTPVPATGEVMFNADGFYVDNEGNDNYSLDGASTAVVYEDVTLVTVPYIDIKLMPSIGASIDDAVVAAIVNSSVAVFRVQRADESYIDHDTGTASVTHLGGKLFRFYFTGADFEPGEYRVVFEAGAWSDSLGVDNVEREFAFTVVTPTVEVAGPFDGDSIDVAALNSQVDDGKLYIDVIFTPAPGENLDYTKIFDSDAEFTFTVGGVDRTASVNGTPAPVIFDFNDDFLLVTQDYEWQIDRDGDDDVDDDDNDLNGDGTVDDADYHLALAGRWHHALPVRDHRYGPERLHQLRTGHGRDRVRRRNVARRRGQLGGFGHDHHLHGRGSDGRSFLAGQHR